MTDAAEWMGRVGRAWADEWPRTDRAFAPLTRHLLAAMAQSAHEHGHALDVGCGAGEIVIALGELRPALKVTGADLSESLIAAARARTDRPNVEFVAGDALAIAAEHAPIDLYVSRHGIMFFDDPVAAFVALRAAAAQDARMVFTCFRDWELNSFASDLAPILGAGAPPPDQPGPFAFAKEAKVRRILDAAGWAEIHATPIDFAFRAGQGPDPVEDAVAFLTRIGPAARALHDAKPTDRAQLLAALAERCRARLTGGSVDFPAAAWLWTARATSKGTP